MSEDAAAGLCGVCCLFLGASFQNWCSLTPLGAGGCCNRGGQGCCGCRCCSDSFDEDSFDRKVQKDLARLKAPNPNPVASQPEAGNDMTLSPNAPGTTSPSNTK